MSSKLTDALAANVRRRRAAAGLSLAELAQLAGTAKGTVTAIERGGANPTVETVHLLAAALGCSVGELLDGAPDPMLVVVRAAEERQRVGTLDGQLLHRFAPTGPVEVFDVSLDAGERSSPPHPDGVYEHVWIAQGRLLTGPDEDPIELGPGDYACFAGWREHRYRALEGPVRMLMLLSLKRFAPALHHAE